MASPTSAFQAEMYPHILDQIVSYAQFSALLALRATSRGLMGRVDVRLAKHILVEMPKERTFEEQARTKGIAPAVLRAPEGRLPLSFPVQRDQLYARALALGHVDLDGVDTADGNNTGDNGADASPRDLAAEHHRHGLQLLKHTRVVDVVGPVSFQIIESLSTWLNGDTLGMLRFKHNRLNEHGTTGQVDCFEDGCFRDVPKTAVIFTLLNPRDRRTDVAAECTGIPDGIERVVVNIAFYPSNPYLGMGDFMLWDYPESLKEVVVIFKPLDGHPVTHDQLRQPIILPRDAYLSSNMRHPPGIVQSFFNELGPSLKQVKHTLVNLSSLPLMVFGIDELENVDEVGYDAALRTALCNYAEDATRERLAEEGTMWSDREIEEAVRGIEFLSMEEYRASVPAEQFEWETVE